MATIALSALRVGLLSSGGSNPAEISAAVVNSAIGAVSVVVVLAGSAAFTLCAAIATPLSRLAECFERGGEPGGTPRLCEAARLDAAVRKLVAEVRSEEREAAAERERQLRDELDRAETSAAGAEARLEGLAPIAEALARLARGDLTARFADGREAHPAQAKLEQAVSMIAKTVLAFSASLDAIRGGAEKMNLSVEAYGEEISKLEAKTGAALGALAAESKAAAEWAAPLSGAAARLRGLVEDAVPGAAGVRGGGAAFAEIRRAAVEIAPILALVDEVAFQTNMLALNAGVEAARVGDAGRGMGVVAQELRLLAQRAARAAKDSSAGLSRLRVEAERGAGELSAVEAALAALPERAEKILAALEPVGRELAAEKDRRDAARTLSASFAAAASALSRLKEDMAGETEALESLIGRLSALTGRFKLESEETPGFRPPPAPRLAARSRGRQNSS